VSDKSEPASPRPGRSEPDAVQLLDEMRAIQNRTSVLARAYWLPLLLFGLVICGSLPFYKRLEGSHQAAAAHPLPSSCAPGQPCTVLVAHYRIVVTALGWYWQVAVPVAVVLSVLWYHYRAGRVGLRTPARAFLISGLVLGELVLLVSLLTAVLRSGPPNYAANDVRHLGPVLVIAAVLWVLAWAERSKALAIIVAVYLVVALPVGVVTGGGIAGGSTGAADVSLATMRLLGLIPALILLVASAGVWISQRSRPRA
jgi:hypothetical protein